MSVVLVVDDEPEIVFVVRLILEAAGHRVIAAETGEIGLRVIDESIPDVVVLDIGLPGMDGWDVLQNLTGAGLIDRLPVIVLSAYGGGPAAARAKAMGCREYLHKPFLTSELIAAVERAATG